MTLPRFLLLDFDNTLMATEQHAVPSLIARFNELYGAKLPHLLTYPEFKHYFHGQAREHLCQNLSRHFNIEVNYAELYAGREWQVMQYYQQLPGGITMAPNLIEVLTLLTAQGVKLALVSNNPIQRALCAMRFAANGQGERLAALFGTAFFEADELQKPNPAVYLRALSQLKAEATECMAIEDSVTGATAALKAGLTTVAFTGFAEDKASLKTTLLQLGCRAVFDKWQDFPTLLD